MADQPEGSAPERSEEGWALLDEAMRKLEEAWAKRTTSDPDLAQLVPVPRGDPRHDWILVRLIRVDQECRAKAGSPKAFEQYLDEWPELRNKADVLREGKESAMNSGAPTVDYGGSGKPGSRIGPYKLLSTLGEGGFGVVYLAEQERPVRRRVALKVIKAGMDTKQVIARFEAERQALAVMDHPNIAKVFDAGVTDAGRPYFVMEVVQGEPITDYCDRHKLTIDERLDLFVPICQAIQHAHQKGIIHRDIKPSNVLVTIRDDHPVPKIIDFGVAKAMAQPLTERTLFTEQGQMIGTPAYMSPEQAEMTGLDIDTRSDVYSLGVMLYELLTGVLPFDQETLRAAGFAGIARIIREEDPPKPSTKISTLDDESETLAKNRRIDVAALRRQLRGELDWIIMKTLEKDRTRRYATALDFAEDIERYMKHEPVEAGPPGALYRLRKVGRKYRLALGIGAAVAFLLVAGAAVSTYFAIESHYNAKEAEDALVRVEEEKTLVQQEKDRADTERQRAQTALEKEEEERRRAEESLYRLKIALAQQHWIAGDVGAADELLDACPPELRHWEWQYLKRVCRLETRNLVGHTGGVRDLAFSSDGKWIASASDDISITIWDFQSGHEVLSLAGHTKGVHCIAFDPKGQRIVSGGADGIVRVWDISKGEEVQTLEADSEVVHDVQFSQDGTEIASAGEDGTVRLWDASNGQEKTTLNGHADSVIALAFSPDGHRIASASKDKTVRVWDLAIGGTAAVLNGHADYVVDVAFSPDGTRIASAGYDKTVKVWNAVTGDEESTLRGHRGPVSSVSFSPDGSWIASAGEDNTVRIWQVAERQEVLTLRGHTKSVNSVVYSPDGTAVVSGSLDGTIKVWDASKDQGAVVLSGHSGIVFSAEFSPDGSQVVSAGEDNAIVVWDANTSELKVRLSGHTDSVIDVAFSPNGDRIASASKDSSVRIWDAKTGRELLTFEGHSDSTTTVAFSPDGRQVASGSKDETVKVWDVATGQEVMVLEGHDSSVYDVEFSPDGTRIVSTCGASGDHPLRVWDAKTGNCVRNLRGHSDAVLDVEFSSDARYIVTGSADNTVRIWDAGDGTELRTMRGHARPVYGVAISPDGLRVASASEDHTIKIWNASSGKEVLTLRGHTLEVTSVCFSPDGQRIVSAGADKTVRLWDATSRKSNNRALRGHSHWIWSVAFSLDGRRLVSASQDRTVRIWDVGDGWESLAFSGHTDGVWSAVFSPDGRLIASGDWGPNVVKVWDAATGEEKHTLSGHTARITTVAFSPDGGSIASGSGDNTVRLWNTASGKETGRLVGHKSLVADLAFTPDGSRIVSGSWDGTVRCWDLSSTQEISAFGRGGSGVTCVAISPDGMRIACARNDDTVTVRDLGTGKELLVLEGHTDDVRDVAFSPDGRMIASASQDRTVRIWDAETGKLISKLCGHESIVTSVAFNPHGPEIASAGYDGLIRIWTRAFAPRTYLGVETARPSQAVANKAGAVDDQGLVVVDVIDDSPAAKAGIQKGDLILTFAGRPAISPHILGELVRTCTISSTQELHVLRDGNDEVLHVLLTAMPTELAMRSNAGQYILSASKHIKSKRYCLAIRLLESAAGMLQKGPSATRPAHSSDRRLAELYYDLGLAYSGSDSPRESQQAYETAVEMYERLTEGPERTDRDQLQLGGANCNLAHILSDLGEIEPAQTRYTKSIATLQELLKSKSLESTAREFLGNAFRGRARVLNTLGRHEEALDQLGTAIEMDPDSCAPHIVRGVMRAELGHWQDAAADFEAAIGLHADCFNSWRYLARVKLHLGASEEYRHACRELIARFGDTGSAARAHEVAWTCVLAPEAFSELNKCVELASRAAAAKPSHSGRQNTLGAALYRAGEFDKALRQLTLSVESQANGGSIWDCLFLAMTHHRLEEEKACEWLDKAVKLIDAERIRNQGAGDARKSWYSRLAEDVLRREAELLILKAEE